MELIADSAMLGNPAPPPTIAALDLEVPRQELVRVLIAHAAESFVALSHGFRQRGAKRFR
jgi:hypothetical protein